MTVIGNTAGGERLRQGSRFLFFSGECSTEGQVGRWLVIDYPFCASMRRFLVYVLYVMYLYLSVFVCWLRWVNILAAYSRSKHQLSMVTHY